MLHFDPKKTSLAEMYMLVQSGVAPRPIALVSTVSADGVHNLSPFSFFNAFGYNPPTVAFGPGRRARDGSLKDTYLNLLATKECVIQVVTHAMVDQVNLASAEYPSAVDEFVKSGLTPVDSVKVKAKRVKESPFQMECVLKQMIALGEEKGSGNIAICEVVAFHVDEDVWNNGKMHPDGLDLVARMGGDYWLRASGEGVIELPKASKPGLGYDQLPAAIKNSNIFTANNLGRLALAERLPTADEIKAFVGEFPKMEASEEMFLRFQHARDYKSMFGAALNLHHQKNQQAAVLMEKAAQCALEKRDTDFAWKAALFAGGL